MSINVFFVAEDGEVYLQRMSGVLYVLAALFVDETNAQGPFCFPDLKFLSPNCVHAGERGRIGEAWTWLSRLLNMPPRADTADFLLAFLEVLPSCVVLLYVN